MTIPSNTLQYSLLSVLAVRITLIEAGCTQDASCAAFPSRRCLPALKRNA